MLNTKVYRAFPAVLLSAVFVAACCSLAAGQASTRKPAPVLITDPVDISVRTTIRNSTHPLVQRSAVLGAIDSGAPMQRMILVLGPGPVQEQQARTFLDGLHTKGSPAYHQWLTPEQYGQKFGPSPQDIQQVQNWLVGQGLAVDSVANSGRWIEFSGSAGAVQAAFHTQIQKFQVGGKVHTANASDISIPAALAPVVRGVLSLHDFYSKPSHQSSGQKATATITAGSPGITFGNGTHAIVPADFANIYNLGPLYSANLNGLGQTIAIVAASNIDLNDVTNFRALFNLPVNTPNIILNGPDPGPDGGGNQAEASLDAEWAGAVAPNATIDIVVSEGTLTTDPVALGAAFIVDQNLAQVMNVSFNLCEQELGASGNGFWSSLWQQAAAQGISVFVSSGDTGAAGCDINPSTTAAGGPAVNGIASTPFNTSVGGTQFNESLNGGTAQTFWQPANGIGKGSALGYIPERAWNESCSPSDQGSVCQLAGLFLFFAGGGGVSTVYQMPSYQTLPVPGLTALSSFNLPASILHPRGQPDVSLSAGALHDPYVFCFSPAPSHDCATSNGVTTFNSLGGGTSFASPAFAGIMALVNQKTGSSQGLPNYVLYSLAAAENFGSCNSSSRTSPNIGTACVFNDTTVAGNGVPGNDVTGDPTPGATGFPAVAGYDLSTGLGSVDATNLVNAWAAAAGSFQGSSTSLAASFNGTPLPSNTLSIIHGQPVSVNVSVTRQNPGATQTPTGNVSLVAQGGNLISGAGLGFLPISGSGGTATSGSAVLNDLPGGTNYTLAAVFPGDGTFAGSTSAPIVVSVGPESSTTTLQSLISTPTGLAPGNIVAYGDGDNILALNAQVTGVSGLRPASGKVSFDIGGVPVFPRAVNSAGTVEIQNCFSPLSSCLPPGTYKVTATYSGDGQSYNPSSSVATFITITSGNPTVLLNSPAAALAGQPVTVNAKVEVPPLGSIVPTGAVQLMDGDTPLGGPVTLTGGQVSTNVTLLSGGEHDIIALYSGDATYNPAVSLSSIINANAPFSLNATTDSQTLNPGGAATFNVVLSGAAGFAGQVTFSCSGAPAGTTCTVNPNPATLSSATATVPLKVTISSTAKAFLAPQPLRNLPLVFAGVLAMALGLKRRPRQRLLMFFAVLVIVGLSACGSRKFVTPPTDATVTLTGRSGTSAFTTSIDLSLTVNH